MEREQRKAPPAMVIAKSRESVADRIEALSDRGYAVRFCNDAWDALGVLSEIWPETVYIGPIAPTPCLDLLVGDLERYGVPYVRSASLPPRADRTRSAPPRIGATPSTERRV